MSKRSQKGSEYINTQKMTWGESLLDISILVVDDDDTSLTIAANILSSWEYKVLTANSAPSALKTLREFEGFFDLVITELHISGVNGFEFQRRVKDEFQLPVVMMSADKRKSVMSKSLENGAAHFVLKPICADDFKDIWQYARKEKPVTDDEELTIKDNQGDESPPSGDDEKVMSQDANSPVVAASSVSSEPKQKRKYKKRISSQMNNNNNNKEDQSEGPTKRSKIVWTTHLHNLFLMAIKRIGLDKAVPKKILEIMNVPNLTRENVASHLQKYRIFLRKVADRGIVEGISDRALRSRFASELPVSVIRDIKTRTGKLKLPVQRYLKGQGGPTIKDLHLSQASNNNSAYGSSTTQLGRGQQFPNLLQGGGKVLQNHQAINDHYSNALEQVRLGKSTFGSRLMGANNHVLEENMLGSYGGSVFDQPKSSYNAGPVFPAYGMEHGLLTSSNALTGGLKFGDTMPNQNNGSLGNQSLLSYGLGNNKMASLSNSNLPLPLSSSSACYPSSVSSGIIQLNGGGTQLNGTGVNGGFNNSVGITNAISTNNNSFGLLHGSYGTQNANMNVTPLALGQGNSGLVQGCYASPPAKEVYANASELAAATWVTNVTPQGNASGIPQLPQQLDGITWNAAGNEYQFDASSNTEGQASQVEDDLSMLFLTLDDMQLLNETRENIDANQFLNSDFPSSSHVMQFPKEPQKAGDVIVPSSTGNNINLPNNYESPISTDKSPTQLQGNDGFLDWEPFDQLFVDNVSTASNSVPEQVWDMELFEAVFGKRAN